MATVRDICAALDEIAPPHLCLGNDPRGLLLGDPEAVVDTVVVSLDVTAAVVDDAKRLGAQLAIAHHPLIFHPLRTLRADQPFPGPVALACAAARVAVACAHTNWDVALGGVNDVLAKRLGLVDVRPLRITAPESGDGIGRIGRLPQPLTVSALRRHLETVLAFDAVRFGGSESRVVSSIAVCGGAGAELATDALRLGADALVTSDVRHHEFVEATAAGLTLIDAGHAATENPGARELSERLQAALPSVGFHFVDSVKV